MSVCEGGCVQLSQPTPVFIIRPEPNKQTNKKNHTHHKQKRTQFQFKDFFLYIDNRERVLVE